ncbi:unnamed protein product [Cuscuta epithymum]|uniref:Uncharacterized protein n=1 Tax=Cuscuta epithymum TaxID=186058 RepID=A0AAV0FLJ7_9ASTE|nr:unnamed protein product [Cuscuta epithymum]
MQHMEFVLQCELLNIAKGIFRGQLLTACFFSPALFLRLCRLILMLTGLGVLTAVGPLRDLLFSSVQI